MGRAASKALRRNALLLGVITVASVALVVGLVLLTGLNPGIAVGLLVGVLAAAVVVYRLWNGPVDWSERQPVLRAVASGLTGLVIVGVLIQVVPYGREHTNPPVISEPAWDASHTRELTVVACFDCHSNDVDYPGYASVAPFSWAVQQHVEAGRRALNFSEWSRPQEEAHEAAETVLDGSMPPWYYTVAHPAARLTAGEKQELADGLAATLGVEADG